MAETLTAARKSGRIPYLRPDGKTQITVAYEDGRPVAITAVVVSTQHRAEIDLETLLRPDIEEQVIRPLLPDDIDTSDLRIFVNPTGRFEMGGPVADAGLTGRKIIVDTYGGMSRHGGGAFSGKDPSKVDRSGAYATRWVAKNIVAAGLARRAELQVAYAIGVAEPVSLSLETFGTEQADPDRILAAVREVFDLRPAAIIAALDLRSPGYLDTAAYGHFGRTGERFTWERIDRVDDLRSAVGA
jgi:S-adenosylmethionine synthetase